MIPYIQLYEGLEVNRYTAEYVTEANKKVQQVLVKLVGTILATSMRGSSKS